MLVILIFLFFLFDLFIKFNFNCFIIYVLII